MYSSSYVLAFESPVSLGNGVYTAVSVARKGARRIGVAFIVDGKEAVLVGIPPADPEVVLRTLFSISQEAVLQRICILGWDDRLVELLNGYHRFAPKAEIVLNRRVLQGIGGEIRQKTIPIGGADDTLVLASGRVIRFLPCPFLFSPAAQIAYDFVSATLFSSRLFETSGEYVAPVDLPILVADVREFHRTFAPSSDYLRPVLAEIAKLDVSNVVLRTEAVYDRVLLDTIISDLTAIEFYNTYQSGTETAARRLFSYRMLASQVLFKLRAAFGEAEVLATFADTEFQVAPITLELSGDMNDDYRLWNRMFDILFLQRGMPWLVVVEPLVSKLISLYGMKKPAVFQSEIASALEKAERIDSAKRELETRVTQLEERLAATAAKMTRDPLSGAYNEPFLHEYLTGILTAPAEKTANPREMALLFVAIDGLSRINEKYSRSAGDETVRHLSYLLSHENQSVDLIAKRNGPGFVLVLTDADRETLAKTVGAIQIAVRDADVFLEPITVSQAVVRLSEFPKSIDPNDLPDRMLAVGDLRIKAALDRGPAAYVDETQKLERRKAGKLLLVDDDPVAISLLCGLLRSESFEVQVASDGIEALEALRQTRFDAIICERNAIKIDGISLKQRLIGPEFHQPPLYILTTYHKTRETIVRANQANIDIVLEKPIIFEELLGFLLRSAIREGGR